MVVKGSEKGDVEEEGSVVPGCSSNTTKAISSNASILKGGRSITGEHLSLIWEIEKKNQKRKLEKYVRVHD